MGMLGVVIGLHVFATGGVQAIDSPPPSDEMSVAQVSVNPGQTVRVPVRVRDISGTLLNEGAGPNNEIQSFTFQIFFPDAFVDSITFEHAGVTAGKSAICCNPTSAADNIYVIKVFDEGPVGSTLAFTLNAPAPGDSIGELVVVVAASTPNGTQIPLTFQPVTNATLANEGGTIGESTGNGYLVLMNGNIVVGGDPIFSDGFE